MADERAPLPDASGWAGQILLLYEAFLLRDLLGYAFPGAVLLLGLDRLCLGQRPVAAVISNLEKNWVLVALALAAAYATGVFLRLAGTWTHALVIGPVVGWCGDPWGLKAAATNERQWWERPWRSRYEAAVEAWYRRAYAVGPGGAARVGDREDIFLHLTGNLGPQLLDHLIRPLQEHLRNGQPECLDGPQTRPPSSRC